MSGRSRVLYGVSSFGRSRKRTVAASAYIDPLVDPLEPLTAADIETVFPKPAGLFGHDRVRKCVCAKNFQRPFERGPWSAETVPNRLTSAGKAERLSRTSQRVRQISSFRSLCGSEQSSPKTLASLKPKSLDKWRARRDSNS